MKGILLKLVHIFIASCLMLSVVCVNTVSADDNVDTADEQNVVIEDESVSTESDLENEIVFKDESNIEENNQSDENADIQEDCNELAKQQDSDLDIVQIDEDEIENQSNDDNYSIDENGNELDGFDLNNKDDEEITDINEYSYDLNYIEPDIDSSDFIVPTFIWSSETILLIWNSTNFSDCFFNFV